MNQTNNLYLNQLSTLRPRQHPMTKYYNSHIIKPISGDSLFLYVSNTILNKVTRLTMCKYRVKIRDISGPSRRCAETRTQCTDSRTLFIDNITTGYRALSTTRCIYLTIWLMGVYNSLHCAIDRSLQIVLLLTDWSTKKGLHKICYRYQFKIVTRLTGRSTILSEV